MGAPQYEQAGADIGGTGTTNTIPRWTGPSTLGDSVITQNSTALVTTGSSSATQTTFRVRTVGTANNAPAFSLYREGVNEHAIWAGSGSIRLGFATDPAGYTDAQLLTATKIGIDSSGNVGIGTTVPASFISTNSTVLAVGGAGNLGTVRVSNTANFSGNHAEFFAGASNVGIWGSSNCPMLFYTNNNERVRIDSNGNIYGTSGTTGMTNGFFYIPAAAGAPTGVPTAVAGRVPMYYDTTNNQFYVYNGAWKKVTLA